ncbi:hypothetical protein PLESTB_001212500 [Pleodorina starrii]|uniref:Cyclic nucleotide-binding domain-containing protein n=1 Tax=Pleodorina starrii TaxID=330485 RepID=A0A9W6F5S9_9CHLO|nr:hypothetical protein PLESTB_001212500 [Pleodorina starrii]
MIRRGRSASNSGTASSVASMLPALARRPERFKWLMWGSISEVLHQCLIMPHSHRYQQWFTFVVVITLLSGWLQPLHMAFGEREQLKYHLNDFWAWQEYIATIVFLMDLCVKFFLTFIDVETGLLVTSLSHIARHYLTSYKFVLDVLSAVPFDWIVVDVIHSSGSSSQVVAGVSFIKMLQLVRFYRVFEFFQQMDYMISLSQVKLLVVRNSTYAFYVSHWSACVMYLIADLEKFGPSSWVGRNRERFIGRPKYEQYLLSLYFSVSAFTGLGDGALFAATVPEAAFMIAYLLFNLFLGAYILGTVTMLVVKGDERSKAFRDRIHSLAEFSKNNELPENLKLAMQEHLEVTFHTDEPSDDQVLGIYPTAIRRKVLRHLYLAPVRNCYLFRGCKQRFLDAVLAACRVELFMPGVQIVVEGDHVSELLVVISGGVSVTSTKAAVKTAFSQLFMMSMSPSEGSMAVRAMLGEASLAGGGDGGGHGAGGSMRALSGYTDMSCTVSGDGHELHHEGSTLSEVPFFTDVPCYESVTSTTVLRVLSLTKAAWEELMEQFPQQARLVLSNLQKQQEAEMQAMLQAAAINCQLTPEQLETALTLLKSEDGLEEVDPELVADTRAALTQAQMDQLLRLDDIRSLVRAHMHKVDQMRTYKYLQQATMGDVEALRSMLNQGVSPNTADYDGRTGLMLAAAAGHEDVIRLLLDHGAVADQVDALGNSALSEACKAGKDRVIDLLLAYGATLNMDPMKIAGIVCTAVYDGDLVKLRRLLRSGAPPDACDYDKRSALHIAGAEGNLAAVKLLVEEGGADPNFQDRWGNTALDEARLAGAKSVATYLSELSSAEVLKGSDAKLRKRLQTELFMAATTGNVEKLAELFASAQPPCLHTAIMMAAAEGHMDAVEALNKYSHGLVVERIGAGTLLDAAEVGHVPVVRGLRRLGVQLADPRDTSLVAALEAAVLRQELQVVVALLEAGVLVTPIGPGEPAAGRGLGPGRRRPSTVLHVAAASGNLDLVRLLVELGGASPVAPNSEGATPPTIADQTAAANIGSEPHRAVADYLRWAASQGPRVSGEVAAAKYGALVDVTAPPRVQKTDEMEGEESGACWPGTSGSRASVLSGSGPSGSGLSGSGPSASGQGGLGPRPTALLPKTRSILKSGKGDGGEADEGQGPAADPSRTVQRSAGSAIFQHSPHSRRLMEQHGSRLSTLRMLAQAPSSAEVPLTTTTTTTTSRLGGHTSASVHNHPSAALSNPTNSHRVAIQTGQPAAAVSLRLKTPPTTPPRPSITAILNNPRLATPPRPITPTTAATAAAHAAEAPMAASLVNGSATTAGRLTFRVPSPELAAAAASAEQPSSSLDGALAAQPGDAAEPQQQPQPRPTMGPYVHAAGQAAAAAAVAAGDSLSTDGVEGTTGGGPGRVTPASPPPKGPTRLSLPPPAPVVTPEQQQADVRSVLPATDSSAPAAVGSTPTAAAAANVVTRLELPRPGGGGGGRSGSGGGGTGTRGEANRAASPAGRVASTTAASVQTLRLPSETAGPAAAPAGAAAASGAMESPRVLPPWKTSAAAAAAAAARASGGGSAAASPRGGVGGGVSPGSAFTMVQSVGPADFEERRRSLTEEALSELSPPPAARSMAKLSRDDDA